MNKGKRMRNPQSDEQLVYDTNPSYYFNIIHKQKLTASQSGPEKENSPSYNGFFTRKFKTNLFTAQNIFLITPSSLIFLRQLKLASFKGFRQRPEQRVWPVRAAAKLQPDWQAKVPQDGGTSNQRKINCE